MAVAVSHIDGRLNMGWYDCQSRGTVVGVAISQDLSLELEGKE
jgi:hypothetical protein